MKNIKKICVILTVVFIISTLSMSLFTVSAADPDDTYNTPKLFYPVTADGKIDGTEWDDAPELVITKSNPVFLAFGRYQSGDEAFFTNIKVTYKMKWDENNLYILEVREDTDPWYYEEDHALTPWSGGNGTLFFISYDNGDPKWANVYEPFWTAKSSDGTAKIALRAFLDGSFGSSDDPEWISNWKYGGSVTGSNSVFELIVPWSDIQKFNEDIGMKATMSGGEKFKFTPIIPKKNESGDAGQINYHDKFGRDDAVTDETSNPGELPANWAQMILVDAIVTAQPEPEEPAPAPNTDTPAPTSAAAPAPVSPTTGDNTVVIFVVMIFAAGAFTIAKRSKIKIK